MKKFLLTLHLQQFADGIEGDSGVEEVPAAGEQEETQTGEEQAAAEPGKQDEAFSKRLSAAQAKWQAEKDAEIQQIKEQYKDFDHYKTATEYLQKSSGIDDLLTLKEQIELANLQERADEKNVPPEVLKRIDELETKAAKADEMEAQAKQQQQWQEFETSLKTFCEGKEIDGKPADHKELWKYMHENEISKPEIAFKALKADALESRLETAKTDAVNEYLKSKQGTKIEGSQGTAAQTYDKPAENWKEAERRALERMKASREAQ